MRVAVSSAGWSGPMPAAESELDIGAVSRELWRRKWRILIPTVLVAAMSFVVVNMLTPRYASEARVLIDSRENVFLRPDAEKSLPERAVLDEQAVASQIQMFLSRDLARDIVTEAQARRAAGIRPAAARRVA